MKATVLTTITAFAIEALAQVGVVEPLAEPCNATLPSVVCINKYAAVMPYHFFREVDGPNSNSRPFGTTSVPKDSSFAQVGKADFVVFDKKRGLELLGPNPSYEYVFEVSNAVHEAPAYVPSQNKLYLSQLAPPPGYLPQLVIDLNANPPTLSEYLSDPPVYAPNGGTFHKDLIYWGASGGNNSIGGGEQRVSLQTLDPETNKTTVLLNNYFGFYFNTIDDLFVHPNGDIWFTDPCMPLSQRSVKHLRANHHPIIDYSWFNKLTDTPPQLGAASYRFRPSTSSVHIVENSIVSPNGIALSPNRRTVYISDTGAVDAPLSNTSAKQASTTFVPTAFRTIYAFDLSKDATYLSGKRAIYTAQDWVPDGLKVAANGYIVAGAGRGVDVVDEQGALLVRVQTNYTVQNFAWTGKDLTTLWLMGQGGISKVEWALKGQDLSK